MFDLNVEQDVPDFAMLWLPPFPVKSATAHVGLVSFSQWSQPGIHINNNKSQGSSPSSFSSPRPFGHDGGQRPLVDISQDHSLEAKAMRQNDRLEKRLAEGGALVRIRVEDCLKIGDENSDWQEPEGTGNEYQYQVDSSPFDRLISATRDFLYSRNEEFQFHRSRRLFNTMRDSFGLRSIRKSSHWPAGQLVTDDLPAENEACSLLRDTDSAVRGFLALARMEAEGGWEKEPSLKLCQIVAAFLAYVVHYKVFPEEPFASRFEKAAILARTAPRLLNDSIRVEDALEKHKGWNSGTWNLWGGQYGEAGRGDLQAGVWPVASGISADRDEAHKLDGGWGSEPARSSPADQDSVEPYIAPLVRPLPVDKVELLEYIPYARRRITKVLPHSSTADTPAYLSQLCRIVTAPSPWTEAEGWRRQYQTNDNDGLSDANDGPLDLETATIEDPLRLDIWVEQSALGDDPTGCSLIGMALRGRWGLFGTGSQEEGSQWWAFRAKDYILPTLWSAPHKGSETTAE